MIKLIIANTINKYNWRKVKKGDIESQKNFIKRSIIAILMTIMKARTMIE